jgi:hypothetical protein
MAGAPNQCPRHTNARLPQAIGGWQLRLICTADAQRAAQTSNSSILVNADQNWRYTQRGSYPGSKPSEQ